MFSLLLLTIILILWLISAVADFSALCYIWQLEEYRWDRFRSFSATEQGRRFFASYLLLWRSLFLLLLYLFSLTNLIAAEYLVLLVFLLELLRFGLKFFKKQLKYPTPTLKSALIVLLAILVEGLVLFLIKDLSLLFLLLILRFFNISLVVSLLKLPTKIAKIVYIKKAAEKLAAHPNLKTIGITGSYGKTTVKHFLAQILEKKFQVVKTPKNINTDIGIARFILKTDFSKVDVFIVEMGAYKKGEIKTICDMVKPKIGILTAITEQHLSLFGSIKNTQVAKYELLSSLPANGLAITNSDNKYCREYVNELECQVKTFGQDQEFKPNLLVDEELKALAKKYLTGEHNAMNLAPVILAAESLGLAGEEIIEQVKELKLPDNTLQIYNYGESVIIDDSYNANPDGFKAALKVLAGYADDYEKIVVTRGMLELGERSKELHQEIGKEIAAVADKLILITPDFKDDLKPGTGDKTEILEKYNQVELLDYIKKLKEKKCAVLLENRISESVLKKITK